jgi:hypothetical protein
MTDSMWRGDERRPYIEDFPMHRRLHRMSEPVKNSTCLRP